MTRVVDEISGIVRAFAYGAAGTAGALVVIGAVSALAYRQARREMRRKVRKATDNIRRTVGLKGNNDA